MATSRRRGWGGEVEEEDLHLIWDETEMDDIHDDIIEEACLGNDYNLHSKGAPKTNDSSATSKMITKKTPTTTTSSKISSRWTKDTRRNPTISQPTKSIDLTHNILGDLKLDYDVVDDLKKIKSNITVFEL